MTHPIGGPSRPPPRGLEHVRPSALNDRDDPSARLETEIPIIGRLHGIPALDLRNSANVNETARMADTSSKVFGLCPRAALPSPKGFFANDCRRRLIP